MFHILPSYFHCKYDITNWGDPIELNGGWVSGLADLNTEKDSVQQRIVDYFVELLSIYTNKINDLIFHSFLNK